MQDFRWKGERASLSSNCFSSMEEPDLVDTPAVAIFKSIDPNWFTLLIYLVALSPAEVIAYQRHFFFATPVETALGGLLIAYPVAFHHLRKYLPRTGQWIFASILAVFLLGLAFGTGVIGLLAARPVGQSWALFLVGVGVVSLATIVGRVCLDYALVPRRWVALCAAFIALILCGSMVKPFVAATAQDLPVVADAVLYRLDHLLSLSILLPLSQIVLSNENLHWAVTLAYDQLLWFALAAIASEAIFAPRAATGLSLRFLVAPCFGFPLYYLMPAIGPAYFFGSHFPLDLPITQEHPAWVATPIATLRNSMPSLHATWSILCCLALRHSPGWLRFLGCLLVFLTAVATIGFGEHYAVDWLGALPLVLLVRGICSRSLSVRNVERMSAIAVGAGMLFGWVVVVRFAPVSMTFEMLPRAYCVASLILPVVLEWSLAKAETRHAAVAKAAQPARTGNRQATGTWILDLVGTVGLNRPLSHVLARLTSSPAAVRSPQDE